MREQLNTSTAQENSPPSIHKRAASIAEFAARWGISRGSVYNLADRGDLKLSKILGRTVVTTEAEEAFAAKVNAGEVA